MDEHQDVVCIIEDNQSIQKLFSILFKKAGFKTQLFGEGLPAVEWLKHNKPYLVVCDDGLPDSNGSEIIKTIRAFPHGKEIKIIVVTGFAQDGDRDRYIALGFNDYMTKPINTSNFVADALKLLGLKPLN